jgi:hypothetical protein
LADGVEVIRNVVDLIKPDEMRYPVFFGLFLTLLYPATVSATHLRAADIVVEQQCGSLTYKIVLQVYMNTTSSTSFGGYTIQDGSIDFGDGTAIHIIPPTPYTLRPDLGPHIGIATYTVFHTYASAGEYKINYLERDRSSGVLNIANSLDVAYSTSLTIRATTSVCNKFPKLSLSPVDRACRGVAFSHNPGAYDADGDSLSYELTIPAQNAQQDVSGYSSPVSRQFYINFDQGNEAQNGPPTFGVDEASGLVVWDAPGIAGEYNIALEIIEWKRIGPSGEFERFSITVRDMQIVVEDCNNARPTLSVPANICVEAGTVINGSFFASDPESDPIKIEIVSPIFEGPPESIPATYTPMLIGPVPSNPEVVVDFEWKTNCIHVREQAYQVVVKVTDQPMSGPPIVTIKTWSIRIIAPAPIWVAATADLVNRTASLQWEQYICGNASSIQLWRKVGSTPFAPGECVAGLSVHKGYALVKELDPGATSFVDDNNGDKLAVGAQYCYRLVATFGPPGNGKSYTSPEFCVGPILADAPVITNVTVVKTDEVNGAIEVRWTKPFEISATQYPEPYEYEVYRADGFTQDEAPVNVSGRLHDVTSFIDPSASTKSNSYNYQIVLYSKTQDNPTFNAIDTSAIASSVRLEIDPGVDSISLEWDAVVPWSNVYDQRPYHRIYRGVAGDHDNELVLIDSVQVNEFGFNYVDKGKFQNGPLREDVFYCYAVETFGTYGNPAIPVLRNRSQMACSYPVSTLPVCAPMLSVKKTDCLEFVQSSCDQTDFENEISWEFPEPVGCRMNIQAIRIYFSTVADGEFSFIDVNPSGGEFQHLASTQALCYKIAAIDVSGLESAISETICNDNCPSYELPNVFTPNKDGCNDVFSAYSPPGDLSSCGFSGKVRCPRAVKHVDFKVFNRWGRLLYEYTSDAQKSVTIDWNGRDSDGKLLEAGVYYYIADVEFDVLDAALAHKRLKGSFRIVL